MPRFRGPEALDLLRGLGYDTPFVVVSSKIGGELRVESEPGRRTCVRFGVPASRLIRS